MVRLASLLIGIVLTVGAATAQDAPPPVPSQITQPTGDERPPAKPDEALQIETATPSQAAPAAPPARPAESEAAPVSPPLPNAEAEPPEAAAAPSDQPPEDPQPEAAPVVPTGRPAWQALAEDEFTYQSCLLGLSMLGVGYTQLDPITSPEDRDCGIARPLNITQIQPGVAIAGGATMRCETARRLALWFRNDAAPAARHLPGAPRITEILPGSTYQCRARVGGSDDKLSEHALGNAFDVSGLRLSDGSELIISPRDDTGDIAEAVQKTLRYTACLHFTTVLGPGSNAAHDDHLHFDIAARNGSWRLCE